MFGGYCAEKLYRLGSTLATRILVLDAGAFLFPSHIQNLPQRLGGKVGGADGLRQSDNGTQNVIWGMPWISNVGFPGLAYCIGGRSLFWGGWSPRLTADDLANWPSDIQKYLNGTTGDNGIYKTTEKEIGVDPSTDYIVQTDLYRALSSAFGNAKASIKEITEVKEAPLAVQGASPKSGILPFDKFSRFHNISNVYVAGPALFPTLGSANPSLTALSMGRKTAEAIVNLAAPMPDPGFTSLSLDPKDWQMVRLDTTPNATVRHYGKVLETYNGYGLYWYTKGQFSNFILKVEWRVGRRDDNSGVYIRIPPPTVPNALQEADSKGHEIQIDERGYDSQTNTEGHPLKLTGGYRIYLGP